MDELLRLRDITRTLREPGGCDWDRAQDYESMRECLVEEAYEVIDAVNRRDFGDLREELGDLLFLVFFYARMAQEEKRFEINDVARDIADKLVRRHPHVFGDEKVEGVGDILSNWEAIKRAEKSGGNPDGESEPDDSVVGIANSIINKSEDFLPALMRAQKIQTKAARVGFDWSDGAGVLKKLKEELGEFEEALDNQGDAAGSSEEVEEELGDLLFTMVNLSRKRELNAELVLNRGTDKFIKRFRRMEELAIAEGEDFKDCSPARKEELWERAKSQVKAASGSGTKSSTNV